METPQDTPLRLEYEKHEPVLRAQGISLNFGKYPVLRDVNIEISNFVIPAKQGQHGQIVALLGPSGIGRTQLSMILAGLKAPTSGEVLLGPGRGVPVHRGAVGFVFQDYFMFEHRTVLGNIVTAARQAGLSKDDAKALAQQLLEDFGVGDKAGHYPSVLSGGQRQRVAIAQSIARQASIIIMDEPISGLDEGSKHEALKIMRRTADLTEQNTLIVITHDRSILSRSDEVWIIGHEADGNRVPIPGARITHSYNMLELRLSESIEPGVSKTSAFRDFDEEVLEKLIVLQKRAEVVSSGLRRVPR